MLNKKTLPLVQFLLYFFIGIVVLSCAVPQKPQGGPRDRNPPKLLKATPPNMTHNFSAKVIQLDFDEYFKINNPFQEISISPAMDTIPEYKRVKKSIVITFKEHLKKNTTYVINFGKAIADVNEGNVLKNFTYVFSTGTHIDSLSMSGNVTNALTQDKEKDVTVMLFTPKEDSLLFGKKKPTVYTTTDTAGNFTLTNLHEGIYKLYALKETAANKVYDNENELIAFPNNTINLQTDTTGIKLRLFKQIPPKLRFIDHHPDLDGSILLTMNKPVEKPAIRIISPANINVDKYVEFSKTLDTAHIYLRNMDFDSLKIALFSNGKPIDTTNAHKLRKESFVRSIYFRSNADVNGLLKPGQNLNLIFNTPIANLDQTLMVLTEDSTVVNNYTLIPDTVNQKHIAIKYPWKQKANYTLVFNEGAITGFYGDKNKKLTKKFRLDRPDNYCELYLKVKVPDSTHNRQYIIQLYNEQNLLIRSDIIKKSTQLNYRNILAAKYKFKVIYDDNNNGIWDTGNLKEKKQPENIWADREVITLRPNWENNKELEIPREPTP